MTTNSFVHQHRLHRLHPLGQRLMEVLGFLLAADGLSSYDFACAIVELSTVTRCTTSAHIGPIEFDVQQWRGTRVVCWRFYVSVQ